jgi:hypothetical protein
MARTRYGTRPGDYFVNSAGTPLRRATVPVYKSPDISQPVTDLLSEIGLPVTAVTGDSAGGYALDGPDNYNGPLYLRDQNGRFKLLEPVDLTQRVGDLETSLDANVADALEVQVPIVLTALGAVVAWAPNTPYTIGNPVLNPAGDVVRAKVAFTSGSVYDPTKWDASTTAADDATTKVGEQHAIDLTLFQHQVLGVDEDGVPYYDTDGADGGGYIQLEAGLPVLYTEA